MRCSKCVRICKWRPPVFALSEAEARLPHLPGGDLKLQRALRQFHELSHAETKKEKKREASAVTLIDCPSSWGALVRNAILASTHLIIPINSESAALETAIATENLVRELCDNYERPLPQIGVLLTCFRSTRLARGVAGAVAGTLARLRVFDRGAPRRAHQRTDRAARHDFRCQRKRGRHGTHRLSGSGRGDRTHMAAKIQKINPKSAAPKTPAPKSRGGLRLEDLLQANIVAPAQRRAENAPARAGANAPANASETEQRDAQLNGAPQILPLSQLRANPEQPRVQFDDAALRELQNSLERDGQLQPIVVRPIADAAGKARYEIIMGERRFRAAQAAGWTHLRAIVREADDADTLRLALIENIQRVDLNAVDKGAALKRLKTLNPGLVWRELGALLGLSEQSVHNMVALLKLPANLQAEIRSGTLNEKHGRALRQLDEEAQSELAAQIQSENLTGDQALARARQMKNSAQKSTAKDAIAVDLQRAAKALQSALQGLEHDKKAVGRARYRENVRDVLRLGRQLEVLLKD